jgi:hypothetical protein
VPWTRICSCQGEGEQSRNHSRAIVAYMFQQQNLTDPDGNQGGASEAVPQIILTMGAARVEAALDIKAASSKPSAFDYVVTNQNVGANTVTVEWVKDCLISRKLTSMER